MTPEQERNGNSEEESGYSLDPDVNQRFRGGMDRDSRFESGLAGLPVQEEEAFAQLGGLGPLPPEEDPALVPEEAQEPVFGLDFSEKGVSDVDDRPAGRADLLEPLPGGSISGFAALEGMAETRGEEGMAGADSAPADVPLRPPMPGLSERLMEAEWLIQELERQPREHPPDIDEPVPDILADSPFPDPGLDFREAASRARKPEAYEVRRQAGGFRRVLMRLFLLILFTGVIAAAALAYWQWPWPGFDTPERQLALAGRLMTRQQYEEAAAAFQRFAELFPQHPRRPEAQLSAALAMRQAAGQAQDQARRNLERAVVFFERFLNDNPEHEQYVRIEALLRALIAELRESEPPPVQEAFPLRGIP